MNKPMTQNMMLVMTCLVSISEYFKLHKLLRQHRAPNHETIFIFNINPMTPKKRDNMAEKSVGVSSSGTSSGYVNSFSSWRDDFLLVVDGGDDDCCVVWVIVLGDEAAVVVLGDSSSMFSVDSEVIFLIRFLLNPRFVLSSGSIGWMVLGYELNPMPLSSC